MAHICVWGNCGCGHNGDVQSDRCDQIEDASTGVGASSPVLVICTVLGCVAEAGGTSDTHARVRTALLQDWRWTGHSIFHIRPYPWKAAETWLMGVYSYNTAHYPLRGPYTACSVGMHDASDVLLPLSSLLGLGRFTQRRKRGPTCCPGVAGGTYWLIMPPSEMRSWPL